MACRVLLRAVYVVQCNLSITEQQETENLLTCRQIPTYNLDYRSFRTPGP
jgi:hypothetical protein